MKKIITIITGVIIFVVVLCGYQRINKNFPENKVVKTAMGEQMEFQEDVYISVEKSKILSAEESDAIYQQAAYQLDFERRILKVTLELENRSNEEKKVAISDLNMESQGMANGVSGYLGDMVEGYDSVMQDLKPGERKQITVGFDILSNMCKKSHWKEIEQREFWLTFALYPKKKILELDLD